MKDLTKPALDRDRVTLSGDCERRYWMARLGATLEELQEALHTAGPMLEDVRAELRRHVPEQVSA